MEHRSIYNQGSVWGGNMFEGNIPEECPGKLPGNKTSWRNTSRGEMSDTYSGSQVCMCSSYDCATLINIRTHRHTVRQTRRQADRLFTSFDRLYY